MAVKVCKFGGTSMAAGNVIAKVKNIVESDGERKYIIVSAPGKRYSDDKKLTDMLYACHAALVSGEGFNEAFEPVKARFRSIVKELNMDFDIDKLLSDTELRIVKEESEDFTASRGEYLNAVIFARYIGAKFVDAENTIFFKENGLLDEGKTYSAIYEKLKGEKRAVLPGFYGTGKGGKIKTFSRGGSDISGAVVARAVHASLYENWTDVSGFLACDPRIVSSPKQITNISYKELRELSYMGANVLHSESIFPVRKANIPIKIKNTFRPDDAGTSILPISRYKPDGRVVTGIAGKKNFTVIYIEKSMMNSEVGFIYKVLRVLSDAGIPVEHIPSGIDTMSLVIKSEALAEHKLENILDEIQKEVSPDVMRVMENIALIATVGHGMSSSVGTSARLFNAIAAANINVVMIDQGSSELNIIVGVSGDDYEKCIKAIYREFFK